MYILGCIIVGIIVFIKLYNNTMKVRYSNYKYDVGAGCVAYKPHCIIFAIILTMMSWLGLGLVLFFLWMIMISEG